MTSTSEINSGISPVLLQAISERLSSKAAGSSIQIKKDAAPATVHTRLFPASTPEHVTVVENSYALPSGVTPNPVVRKQQQSPADESDSNPEPTSNTAREHIQQQMVIHGERAISIPTSLLQNQSKIIYLQNDGAENYQSEQPSIILCYPDDIPAPVNDVVVTTNETNTSNPAARHEEDITKSILQFIERPQLDNSGVSDSADSSFYSTASPNVGVVNHEYLGQACPICGDRVSGYHYGVVSCESCKGFFKRTVQNRRTFVCPRQGDCNIVVVNRKKCPACRFGRCIMAGMKVEAIRTDRSRGGRSYYDGCSPRIRPKIERPKQKITPKPYNRASNSSHSHLVAILSAQGPSRAHIPQLLVDIMSLDCMLDDKGVLDLDMNEENNAAMFAKLLQLAELRLYRLVRWARALPQFSSIPTEDQIVLLQNSWLDLLILGVAYSSMYHPGKVHIAACFEWSFEEARAVSMETIFGHVVNLADLMARVKLDKYECAVLKVLAIISPDVDGLMARSAVLDHQQKLSVALHLYTESQYPGQRNRFSNILLVLSGLIKASILGKTLLSSETLGEHFYQCDLLMELIQGRNNPNAT